MPKQLQEQQQNYEEEQKYRRILCSVYDYEREAQRILPKAIYEYLTSGTYDEQTLYENRISYKLWYLRPRCIVRSIGNHVCTKTTIEWNNNPLLTSQSYTLPLFVSPAGVHGLFEPLDGEISTAKACYQKGILYNLSQHSTRSIEDVGTITKLSLPQPQRQQNDSKDSDETNVPSSSSPQQFQWWYQAYIVKDRNITIDMIQRAVIAGCCGIIITIDSVVFGTREADIYNGFTSLPLPHRLVNYDKYTSISPESRATQLAWDQNLELMWDRTITWDDIYYIRQQINCPHLPFVVKGIMTPEDAILAINYGRVDGIIVSNHGGRQLDGCIATIDALPAIVHAVRNYTNAPRTPILLDGGIMRGTDILKALALGATMVGIGKAMFYGLSVNGQKGVEDIIDILHNELKASMALTGCSCIADIHESVVMRHPYENVNRLLPKFKETSSSLLRSAL